MFDINKKKKIITNGVDTNKIIEKLKQGEFKMRPKWHFVLRVVLVAILIILFLLSALFLFSLILFPSGPFPWPLLILVIIFIALLEYFLQEFKIVYRRPIIYSFLIILCLLIISGLFLNKVHFHQRIEKKKLPGIERFYRKFPPRPETIRNPSFEIKNKMRM